MQNGLDWMGKATEKGEGREIHVTWGLAGWDMGNWEVVNVDSYKKAEMTENMNRQPEFMHESI